MEFSFNTFIDHEIKKELHINCNEYCILDLFHREWKLANSFSRQDLADGFGLSKTSVILTIKALVKEGLLDQDGKFYTVTDRWRKCFPELDELIQEKERGYGKPIVMVEEKAWHPMKDIV